MDDGVLSTGFQGKVDGSRWGGRGVGNDAGRRHGRGASSRGIH
jgi:hypothetical protein